MNRYKWSVVPFVMCVVLACGVAWAQEAPEQEQQEPVVEQGLYSEDSKLVYPIVSDIPIMLIDEALPAAAIGR